MYGMSTAVALVTVASLSVFFFTVTPPTELYPLSLHDALPIYENVAGPMLREVQARVAWRGGKRVSQWRDVPGRGHRSEEHTSELQSRVDLVCRLLLEKKHNGHGVRGTGTDRDADAEERQERDP